MTFLRFSCCAAALCAVLGCTPAMPDLDALAEPQVSRLEQAAPPGAAAGTCWGKHVTPGIFETVTEQVVLQPAEVLSDGTVVRPASYKTETRQRIVRERRETWFETPCPAQMTPEFVASVQRALAARGLYRGHVSGEMDARTRAAVRRFQKPEGLDSGILSLASARKLGLVAIELEESEEG
ncbi:peptidoglycan-binding protein [Lutimaribacter marinistellae]|uniref:Peptidoglycan-binding protein n=1 Tax=Lutimaribacter marinistellae TaxID=1820329 RepID=A0ABV7TN36_9RHOB